jgi:hypothetical protein
MWKCIRLPVGTNPFSYFIEMLPELIKTKRVNNPLCQALGCTLEFQRRLRDAFAMHAC